MIPRHPTVEHLRAHELDLLAVLEAEQRQPEVRPWTRWDAFLLEVGRAGIVIEQRAQRRRKRVA